MYYQCIMPSGICKYTHFVVGCLKKLKQFLLQPNITVRCTYKTLCCCGSYKYCGELHQCDLLCYYENGYSTIKITKLLYGYTGAAHQQLCCLNNNGCCRGAAHRNIFLLHRKPRTLAHVCSTAKVWKLICVLNKAGYKLPHRKPP
jgi:hypothetical protein